LVSELQISSLMFGVDAGATWCAALIQNLYKCRSRRDVLWS